MLLQEVAASVHSRRHKATVCASCLPSNLKATRKSSFVNNVLRMDSTHSAVSDASSDRTVDICPAAASASDVSTTVATSTSATTASATSADDQKNEDKEQTPKQQSKNNTDQKPSDCPCCCEVDDLIDLVDDGDDWTWYPWQCTRCCPRGADGSQKCLTKLNGVGRAISLAMDGRVICFQCRDYDD